MERGGIMNGVERVRMRERMHQLADMANIHRVALVLMPILYELQ